MTQRPTQTQLDTLAAYLDGTLSADQRTAFEAAAARDPVLKAEIDFHRQLDGSLTRLFDHDDKPAQEAPAVVGTITPATAAPSRRVWWLAAAAALLLAVTLSIYLSGSEDPKRITPDVLYARMEGKHWVPEWKCKDDQEFIETVQKRLGEGMLIPGDTEGLEVIGWAYGSDYDGYPISPTSMILITKKDNDHVLLIVDKLSADARLDKPHKGLNLYRDTVGGLVLYELSPRSDRVVIPVAKQNQSKASCPSPNGKP